MRVRDAHAAYVNAVKDFLSPHEAAREAALVITDITGLSRARQISDAEDALTGDADRLVQIIAARRTRQPLAQILGHAPFRDRSFRVTPDVLCPRADTETLVDLALAANPRRILDLGTGPGTIALTLLSERPGATAVASDISAAALRVAAENARDLGVAERVTFLQSDWLHAIEGTFDLITSNPPYVDAATYETLAPEITRWEPRIALTPEGDGLAAYGVIAGQAPAYLAPGGHLMVEIGHDQGAAVADLFIAAGLADVEVHLDLSGKARVVTACKPRKTGHM